MAYAIRVPSQLSSHLRALRKAKGWSQAELGARLGLSQARVARIEGEPLSISVGQLLRVLAALDVGVALEPMQVQGSHGTTFEIKAVSAVSLSGKLTTELARSSDKDKADW